MRRPWQTDDLPGEAMIRAAVTVLTLALAGCGAGGSALAPGDAAGPSSDWLAEVGGRIAAGQRAIQPAGSGFQARSDGRLAGRWSDGVGWFTATASAAGEIGLSLAGPRGTFALAGCQSDGAIDPLGRCLPRLQTSGDEVTEWWEARPRGFEHGFTVHAPPLGAGARLALDVDVIGAQVDVRGDGSSARLSPPTGTPLSYSGLRAWDSTGLPLEAHMRPRAGGLTLVVGLTPQTTWPVTVDPLLDVVEWSWQSDVDGAYLGWDAHGAGDVNGDGYGDVIVGAPAYSDGETGEGAAFAFYGGPAGLATSPSWTAQGGLAERGLGISAATAGDVNCDGYADVIVGAGMTDPNDAADWGQGEALVYLGSSSGLEATEAWATVGLEAAGGYGYKVASAGDVDGDGCSEVIIGEPQVDGTAGRVSLFMGSASGLAATADWTYGPGVTGCNGVERCGFDVASAGDLNGDGYSDVAFTSYSYDLGIGPTGWGRGAALVFMGSATGLGSAHDTLVHPPASGSYGISLASAGDVNGDGYSDLIVGASRTDSPLSTALGEGAAFVYYGSPAGITAVEGTQDWAGWGLGHAHYYGRSVAGVGDLNGDGFGDVVIGAHTWHRAEVLMGSPTGLPDSTEATMLLAPPQADYSGFGQVVGPAGDVDGDGLADVVIGAYWRTDPEFREGAAYVYYGSARPSVVADQATAGWTAGDDYGLAVASPGDVDGDGYDDFAVGAPHADGDRGTVYLFAGAPEGPSSVASWSSSGGQTGGEYGATVAAAGDVHGDGYADLAIGAPGWDGDSGAVFLFSGDPAGLDATADVQLTSPQAGSRFGEALASAGDTDRDGRMDLLVGAPSWHAGAGGEGRADLFAGSATGLQTLPTWTLEGVSADDGLGTSVAGAGDVNGDGYADVLLGIPGFDTSSPDAGRVELYAGSPVGPGAAPVWSADGGQDGAALGSHVAGVGDVDRDGYADVAATAPGLDDVGIDEGAVSLWFGGATGPSASPDWTATGGQDSAGLSVVAPAGDVDGDGYADLLLGAPGWDSALIDVGQARLHMGGPGGPASAPAWDHSLEEAGVALGGAVASAGDVDGDGLSDLLVGAPLLGAGMGAAQLFRGGGFDGSPAWDLHPRATQASTGLPVPVGGRLQTTGAFDVHLVARSSAGPARVKLQVEVKPHGAPFDGVASATSAVWTLAGPAAVELSESITGLAPETAFHWRARVLFHPAGLAQQVASRWVWGGEPGHAEGVHLRSGCAADMDGDGACDSYDPDVDGDGFAATDECDDTSASVHPGATEVVDDAVDQDCNGVDAITCQEDLDEDGFGTAATVVEYDDADCSDDAGQSALATDCDDADPAIHPSATEVCNLVDDQCDGAIDEGFDVDADGVTSCDGDCDDADPVNFTGNVEICDGQDNDCAGGPDFDAAGEVDADGDGVLGCAECDDADPANFDGNVEVCDGQDNDCNAAADFDAPGEIDVDADGWISCADCDDADPANHPTNLELCDGQDNDCDPATSETGDSDGDGTTPCGGDCDDTDPAIFEGNPELCDGLDNDCDPATDEWTDLDGDGWALCNGDCDETSAVVHPAADEGCDGIDTDCDGVVPDPEADLDDDGVSECDGDCDDDDPENFPGNAEMCDGQDNDCDGLVTDEEADEDGDGFSPCGGDCDDTEADTWPGAEELCDGLDNDCVDAVPADEVDEDDDGVRPCEGDCDDGDPAVSPTHPESDEPDCVDTIDNDCDGDVDRDDADCDSILALDLAPGCDAQCSATTSATHPLPLLLLPALLLRRRRP
jgi:hypothetical protein